MRHHYQRTAALIALLLAVPACTVSSRFMTSLDSPQAIEADTDRATVVFVRPSGFAGGKKVIILDERGHFVGECWGNTYFPAAVQPGEHTFVAWNEGTHALRARLEAGRVYYVEVSPTIGVWTARVRLRALGPGRERWDELAGWLQDAQMLLPNADGQAWVDRRPDRAEEVARKGLATWDGYDAETRAERTLDSADGVAAPIR